MKNQLIGYITGLFTSMVEWSKSILPKSVPKKTRFEHLLPLEKMVKVIANGYGIDIVSQGGVRVEHNSYSAIPIMVNGECDGDVIHVTLNKAEREVHVKSVGLARILKYVDEHGMDIYLIPHTLYRKATQEATLDPYMIDKYIVLREAIYGGIPGYYVHNLPPRPYGDNTYTRLYEQWTHRVIDESELMFSLAHPDMRKKHVKVKRNNMKFVPAKTAVANSN